MSRYLMRIQMATTIPTLMALALALGWALRERAHAREPAALLASQTVNLDQLKMDVYKDQGKPVGQVGLYVQGETPGCSSLVAGRFIVDPGKSPHPPHVHDDEEMLIVESGQERSSATARPPRSGPAR